MESILFTIMDAAESIFHFVWFPVLIWTIIGSAVWMMVRQSDRIHPQYHYHTRLGLIFALPAGLLMLAILQWVQTTFMGTTEGNLVFVTVMAPLDIGVANQQESASLSLLQWSVLSACFVYFTGMLIWLFQLTSQWFTLQRLKRQYTFTPIRDIPQADQLNLQTDRPVNISFVSEKIVPVTFGYRKPVILVPSYLADQPEKLVLAIRHELTHIRERDFLTHLFVSVSSALFWFHPLIHKLKRELTEYREIRCDRLVLSEPRVSKKEYASLLFELLPMPNLNKELSVNMAQESTNLKKRITMITQNDTKKPIPTRSSLAILSAIFLSTALAMACTDMQTQNVFDEEELDLMTNFDSSGERDYQQILIYMGDDGQADRHENALENLNQLQPEYIESITVLRGQDAVEKHGQRASNGVIVVRTKGDTETYNTALGALGMEPIDPEAPPTPPEPGAETDEEDYFVVVENMPELIGGLASIQSEIEYPESARNAGIEGRVYVQFIVNEEGDVEEPRVIRGIGGGADEVALEAVKKAKFKPGYQRGKPVRVQYSLPVVFRLQGPENTEEG